MQSQQLAWFDRKFIVDVTWGYVSLGVVALSGLLLNVVIARYYGQATLGVFGQLFAFLTIASQLAVGGFVAGLLHYLPSVSEAPSQRDAVFTSAMYPMMVLAAAVSVVIWLSSGTVGYLMGSPEISVGLRLISPGIFLFAINKCLLFSLSALRLIRLFATGQMLRVLFYLVTLLALTAAGVDSVLLPLALTLGEGLLTLFLIGAAYGRLTWRLNAIDLSWMFRLLRHSRSGFFIGVLSDINLKIDVIMLGFFVSDASVGIYVFMAMFADGFAQLPVVLQNNLNPLLGKVGPRKGLRPYLVRLHLYVLPVMAVIATIATLALPTVANFLTGDPSFGSAWPLFGVLAVGIVLTSGASPFFFVLNQIGRPDLQTALYATGVILNILGNAILIPVLGLAGAALATSLTLVLMAPTVVVLYRIATGHWIWAEGDDDGGYASATNRNNASGA